VRIAAESLEDDGLSRVKNPSHRREKRGAALVLSRNGDAAAIRTWIGVPIA
jgi:hypothetical protein